MSDDLVDLSQGTIQRGESVSPDIKYDDRLAQMVPDIQSTKDPQDLRDLIKQKDWDTDSLADVRYKLKFDAKDPNNSDWQVRIINRYLKNRQTLLRRAVTFLEDHKITGPLILVFTALAAVVPTVLAVWAFFAPEKVPVPRLEIDHLVGYSPLPINAKAYESWDTGKNLKFRWEIDGIVQPDEANLTFSHSFEKPDEYAISVIVTDGFEIRGATKTVTVLKVPETKAEPKEPTPAGSQDKKQTETKDSSKAPSDTKP